MEIRFVIEGIKSYIKNEIKRKKKRMEEKRKETTDYISSSDWFKFVKGLKKVIEAKIKANPDAEQIIIEREELDLCWPEVRNDENHHRYFAELDTVATLLDAEVNIPVVADYQNGEKLIIDKEGVSRYATLKSEQKRLRLLTVLFMVTIILFCLNIILMFYHPVGVITLTLFTLLVIQLSANIDKNKFKLEELREIEKTIAMVRPSLKDVANSMDPIDGLMGSFILEMVLSKDEK